MNKATITAVTAECSQTDCRLYSNGLMATLAHIPDTYDRDGNLLPRPATAVIETVGCTTCGAKWNVTQSSEYLLPVAKRLAA